ncbi:MAG: alpha/beta hydrolase [Deltaproteobacteria bacterium]|nr:alpha/beta hydrolase [Deltaproteobacteria bacterium]
MGESTSFLSGALRLEARLDAPPAPTRAAVICHPHPLYGGSMDNNVVEALAAACLAADCLTLRFNFRGVGGSAGGYGDFTGECDDARAALDVIATRGGDLPVILTGYSFGALVALTVGAEASAVQRLIAVAPPLGMAPNAPLGSRPTLLLAGDSDSYCPPAALAAAGARLGPHGVLHAIGGGDHFLVGREPEIERAVAAFLASPGAA